jgi:HAE1 family hydrophobic/amphiphilic exporter-1
LEELSFESYLTRFINWIWLTDMVFGSLKQHLPLFYAILSSIALVPAGFIGGEFFAASDSGEFFQISECQRCSLEQTNFMTQKKQKLFRQRRFCSVNLLLSINVVVWELHNQLLTNQRLT